MTTVAWQLCGEWTGGEGSERAGREDYLRRVMRAWPGAMQDKQDYLCQNSDSKSEKGAF